MTRRFEDAVVLITGAAGGLGQAAAARFAQEGARLVLSDIDGEGLAAAAERLGADGHRVETLAGDVAAGGTHTELVRRAVDAFGRLDVAVNNAGLAHPFVKLTDTDPALMERMLAVNLMGVFHALRAQIPVMQRQFAETGRGGAILNVASVAGLVGAPLLAAYAAAKHGVVGLTKSAAAETARRGVRVNAICPAFTDTKMVTGFLPEMRGDPLEAVSRIVAALPMQRLGQPDEVVEAMLFACDPRNGFMTGQAIAVDGGLTAV